MALFYLIVTSRESSIFMGFFPFLKWGNWSWEGRMTHFTKLLKVRLGLNRSRPLYSMPVHLHELRSLIATDGPSSKGSWQICSPSCLSSLLPINSSCSSAVLKNQGAEGIFKFMKGLLFWHFLSGLSVSKHQGNVTSRRKLRIWGPSFNQSGNLFPLLGPPYTRKVWLRVSMPCS